MPNHFGDFQIIPYTEVTNIGFGRSCDHGGVEPKSPRHLSIHLIKLTKIIKPWKLYPRVSLENTPIAQKGVVLFCFLVDFCAMERIQTGHVNTCWLGSHEKIRCLFYCLRSFARKAQEEVGIALEASSTTIRMAS